MPKSRTTRAKELSALTIKLIGNAVFDKAQELVPEGESGNLKKSGSISFDSKGFKISYSAPYAKQVHDGDVARMAYQRGYRVSARVHTYLWGNLIGV